MSRLLSPAKNVKAQKRCGGGIHRGHVTVSTVGLPISLTAKCVIASSQDAQTLLLVSINTKGLKFEECFCGNRWRKNMDMLVML